MKRLVWHSLDSGSAGTGNVGGSFEAAGFLIFLTQLWQGAGRMGVIACVGVCCGILYLWHNVANALLK